MSMERMVLKVDGMSCAACSGRIEKALSSVRGVASVEAVFSGNTVAVEYDPDVVSLEVVKNVLSRTGYPVREKADTSSPWNLRSIGICASISIVLMILSMGSMLGLDVPLHDDPGVYGIIQMMTTIPVIWLCRMFFTKGIPALIGRSPTMDTLVSLGSGCAFVYSAYLTMDALLLGGDATGLCFDSSAMILTLISVGKYLEHRSRLKADDAVERLLGMIPDEACVLRDGEEVSIGIRDLTIGDMVVIRPGDRIPADGSIVHGGGPVDESMLTGESDPVNKNVGDPVYTGTVNINGSFRFTVTGLGEDTMISEIARLMDDAKATKAPVARMADRVASRFVPAVILIGSASALLWFISGRSIGFSLKILISVLVISCPCALGLATPLAITVGSGKAAEHGILFRDAASLERCGRVDSVIFDKTGTVTNGRTRVASFTGDPEILGIVMSAESGSEHPIAKAIVDYCESLGVEPSGTSDFSYEIGMGVSAITDRGSLRMGTAGFCGCEQPIGSDATVCVSLDGAWVGGFAFIDGIRPEAPETVSVLKELGTDVMMVSGDAEESVRRVAEACGIDHHVSRALPSDKIAAVKRLQAREHDVMMVGDGINDSPALAQADVGVAMGSGTGIALGASDVIVLNDDLRCVPRSIEYGRRTLRNIRENLFLAFLYNAVCIPLAAGLPYLLGMPEFQHMPVIAAAAMSLSSLSVVANALRLRGFDPDC